MDDALQTAFEHHQRGRLQEACQLYQAILARDPHHADAIHLLGVAAHQMGAHRQVAELIGRAISLCPAVAAYHANLAEVWRALGRLDQALACGRTALQLQPDSPEAANNLGLALQRSATTPRPSTCSGGPWRCGRISPPRTTTSPTPSAPAARRPRPSPTSAAPWSATRAWPRPTPISASSSASAGNGTRP
jgi:tetratricopeptide (TPR) repeat protein